MVSPSRYTPMDTSRKTFNLLTLPISTAMHTRFIIGYKDIKKGAADAAPFPPHGKHFQLSQCLGLNGLHNFGFQFFGQFGIIQYQILNGFASLSQLGFAITEPAAAFLNDVQIYAQIHNLTGFGDALTVHNVEFGLTEGRRYFVLDHFHAGLVAHHLIAVFQLRNTTDIQTDGSVKFKGVTSGSGFGVTKHYTDFLAQLVDEDAARSEEHTSELQSRPHLV